jgi:hypothetical protein
MRTNTGSSNRAASKTNGSSLLSHHVHCSLTLCSTSIRATGMQPSHSRGLYRSLLSAAQSQQQTGSPRTSFADWRGEVGHRQLSNRQTDSPTWGPGLCRVAHRRAGCPTDRQTRPLGGGGAGLRQVAHGRARARPQWLLKRGIVCGARRRRARRSQTASFHALDVRQQGCVALRAMLEAADVLRDVPFVVIHIVFCVFVHRLVLLRVILPICDADKPVIWADEQGAAQADGFLAGGTRRRDGWLEGLVTHMVGWATWPRCNARQIPTSWPPNRSLANRGTISLICNRRVPPCVPRFHATKGLWQPRRAWLFLLRSHPGAGTAAVRAGASPKTRLACFERVGLMTQCLRVHAAPHRHC